VDFAKVLAEIAEFLDRHRMRFALGGELAMHALGISRTASSMEFIVEERGREALLEHLDALGYERIHVSGGHSNHRHPNPKWGRIDFIYVDARTGDRTFAAAARLPIFAEQSAPVPRPEHLAGAMLLELKTHPERRQKILADIEALLQLPGVDAEEVRRQLERLRN
jgi:hypothetical protein